MKKSITTLLACILIINTFKTVQAQYYDDPEGVLEYYDDPYGSLQDYCQDYGDDLDGYCDDFIDEEDITTPEKEPQTAEEKTYNSTYDEIYRINEEFKLPSGEKVKPIPRQKAYYEDPYQITELDFPTQGLNVGDKLETGEVIEEFNINTELTIPEIAQNYTSESEKYEIERLARDVRLSNTMLIKDEAGNIQEIPVKASQKTQDDFNSQRFIDIEVLNQEFLILINRLREKEGLNSVEYGSHLQQGVDNRAADLASIGSIYINREGNVRLDGSSYVEDYLYLDKPIVFEDNVIWSYNGNPYRLVSEKNLASKAFKQFKKSDYSISQMTDPNAKYIAISIKMGHYNLEEGNKYNSLIASLVIQH